MHEVMCAFIAESVFCGKPQETAPNPACDFCWNPARLNTWSLWNRSMPSADLRVRENLVTSIVYIQLIYQISIWDTCVAMLDSVKCCSAGAGSRHFYEGLWTQSGCDPQETLHEFPHTAVNQDLLTHKGGNKDIQSLTEIKKGLHLSCLLDKHPFQSEENAHCFWWIIKYWLQDKATHQTLCLHSDCARQ